MSSEFGSPREFLKGFNPAAVAPHYGSRLHVWSWEQRKLVQVHIFERISTIFAFHTPLPFYLPRHRAVQCDVAQWRNACTKRLVCAQNA